MIDEGGPIGPFGADFEALPPADQQRIIDAYEYRVREALAAGVRAVERTLAQTDPAEGLHQQNKDEELFGDTFAMSFTKGLEHDPATGLVNSSAQATALRTAVDGGNIGPFNEIDRPGFEEGERQWEAPTAGFVFELEGPDAQGVTMPPAPAINEADGTFAELTFEMAEVYELGLLRDKPLSIFEDGANDSDLDTALGRLNGLDYVSKGVPTTLPDLTSGAGRPRKEAEGVLTAQTVFRGSSYGAEVGPYLSQFMLIGNLDAASTPPEDQGKIVYGNQFVDQRVRNTVSKDYMITWDDWRRVQEGANTRRNDELFAPGTRFIHTPRDLATYVHDDALYQAYLNACLILLGMGAPFDPNFDELSGMGPVHGNNNAGGFALFGGPHILSLVTEVATRGLKAVRYQKFQNHFRLRPETLAGRLVKAKAVDNEVISKGGPAGRFQAMAGALTDVMAATAAHNDAMGGDAEALLPMAFQEGSPMHPAYGAGHATVAGACVTILKAFFDTDTVMVWRDGRVTFARPEAGDVPVQFVTVEDGARLEMQVASTPLTLLGELNKLAANISIGRNMAGVHYFSDYYDSARMGEEIAVGILEEQAHGYQNDKFTMTLTPFDAPEPRCKVKIERGNRITKQILREPKPLLN